MLDKSGENEFLIASKSILQTPMNHWKESYISINSAKGWESKKKTSSFTEKPIVL